MREDPVAWIYGHIEKGDILRAEAFSLDDNFIEIEKCERRVIKWGRELEEGVERYNSRDVHRVHTVGRVSLALINSLPADSHFHDAAAVGKEYTATAKGAPGHNWLSFLDTQLERAREVAQDWRERPPKPPEVEETEKPPPLKERAAEWARRMGYKANHDIAVQLAKEEAEKGWPVTIETIKREVQKVPEYSSKRRKSG